MPGSTQPSDNPLLTVTGSIAELRLNAPEKKNALSLAAWKALPDLLSGAAEMPDIRMLVVKGAGGRAFCAGADISEFAAIRSNAKDAAHYDALNVAAFKALKAFPAPVVAAIEGPCLGGGLGLALACDLRIAEPTAFFGIPAAKLGLAYPPDALGDLLEAVSVSNAKRLLFTAERLSASDALTIGLVDEVTGEGELEDRIKALGNTISANAPLSLKAAKQTLNALAAPALEGKAREQAIRAADNCISSNDYGEGCRAFLEKRSPRFEGH